MLWSAFRTQMRRSILKDPDKKNWDDDSLLDYLHDAIKLFCSHTAAATSCSFDGDGDTTVFTLPDNLYESVDISGTVYKDDGTTKTFLQNASFTGITAADATNYMTFPDGCITLFEVLPVGTSLKVMYYAIPTLPIEDTDVVPIPVWAHAAIKYMMAVYALSAPAVRQAGIRQWGTKPDTGDPEDNSYSKPLQWFIDQYEIELGKHTRQNRTAFKRNT